MSRLVRNRLNLGGRTPAERADRLSESLRLYRDLRFERGEPESYQLTGQLAELATVGEMLPLSKAEQERHAVRLIEDAEAYLRYLRRGCDA